MKQIKTLKEIQVGDLLYYSNTKDYCITTKIGLKHPTKGYQINLYDFKEKTQLQDTEKSFQNSDTNIYRC